MQKSKKPHKYEIYCNGKGVQLETILKGAYKAIAATDISNFVAYPKAIDSTQNWPHCKFSLMIESLFNTHPEVSYLRAMQEYLDLFGHMNYAEVPAWLDDVLKDNYAIVGNFLEKAQRICEKYHTNVRFTYPASFIENHEAWFNMLDSSGVQYIAIYKKLFSYSELSTLLAWKDTVSKIQASVLGSYKSKKHSDMFNLNIRSLIVNGQQYVHKSV